MNRNLLRRHTGLLLAAAICWAFVSALALGLLPVVGLPGAAHAQSTATTTAASDDADATAEAQQEAGTGSATQTQDADGDGAEAPAADAAQAADTGAQDQAADAAQAADTGDEQPMADGAQAGDAREQDQAADAAQAADTGDEQPMADGAQAGDAAAPAPPATDTAPATGSTSATDQGAVPGSGSGSSSAPATSGTGSGSGSSSTAMSGMGGELSWGRDYLTWEQTTGYVNSAAHGNRLLVTYVTPPDAAKVYRGNAALVRNNRQGGFQPFPPGTQIVAESFRKGSQGKPGPRGPLFLMKKEAAGGGWQYAFAAPDFRLLGEGTTGRVAFCQACHETGAARDAVFAVDR